MMKSVIIAGNQRGLLVKAGQLADILEPGTYRFWLWNAARCEVEVLNATGACVSRAVEGIEILQPALAERYFETARPGVGEVAIVRVDGLASLIVRGGDIARIWTALQNVSVEIIDVEAQPKLPGYLLAELSGVDVFGKPLRAPIETIYILKDESAVVLFDGKFSETIGSGPHGYWQIGRSVMSKTLNLRTVQLEADLQEVLTKDLARIAMMLKFSLRVTDVERAVMVTPDYQSYVHRLIQRAAEKVVAGRTLAALLNDLAKLDGEILAFRWVNWASMR